MITTAILVYAQFVLGHDFPWWYYILSVVFDRIMLGDLLRLMGKKV